MSERVDRFGAAASTLCAVHCAVCALMPAAFAALGLGFLLGHQAEWIFTLVAIAFATGALLIGWRRHGSMQVAALLVIGITGLLMSRGLEMGSEEHHGHHDAHGEHLDAHHGFGHELGTKVGVLAGLLLFCGHTLNIRATRRCREDCCQ